MTRVGEIADRLDAGDGPGGDEFYDLIDDVSVDLPGESEARLIQDNGVLSLGTFRSRRIGPPLRRSTWPDCFGCDVRQTRARSEA